MQVEHKWYEQRCGDDAGSIRLSVLLKGKNNKASRVGAHATPEYKNEHCRTKQSD